MMAPSFPSIYTVILIPPSSADVVQWRQPEGTATAVLDLFVAALHGHVALYLFDHKQVTPLVLAVVGIPHTFNAITSCSIVGKGRRLPRGIDNCFYKATGILVDQQCKYCLQCMRERLRSEFIIKLEAGEYDVCNSCR